jgi:alkanesulfonate monooxygenase SsuD/methylene tetrahydromethanopterin reductase-like flavin-dependent oxidoreductase (luciferase family)
VTTRLKFGAGVFLIPQHNPVQFAKELASLDLYSGGRLIVGAGIGWSQVQCELLGGHWLRRWAQTRESIKIMKLLWSQETVTYDGEFYTLPPVQLFPQPANKVGPPVLIGVPFHRGLDASESKVAAAMARIVEYGDGWIPAFPTDETVVEGPAAVESGRRLMNELAEDAGRDPQSLQITAIVRGGQVDGDLGSGLHSVSHSLMSCYEEAGADRVLISLPTISHESDVRPTLERIAELVL